jgi:uncharacterized protein YjeT (DUF2065 family)
MTAILVLSYLAVLALLAYALARAWRQAVRQAAPLPLNGMLRSQGLTLGEAGNSAGIEALAHAARRCAFCGSGAECRRRIAERSPSPAHCPNGALFARLARPSA